MNEEIKVNDGGGLFDSIGLVDTLIVDCNALPKTLINGQYVGFCAKIVEMVQKLSRLREGISNDIKSRDEIIADKTRLIAELTGEGVEN